MASNRLLDADPALQSAYVTLKSIYLDQFSDHDLLLVCTFRDPTEQFALFQRGRALKKGQWIVVDPAKVVTQIDGVQKKGKHNVWPSRALDCAIVVQGKLVWDAAMYVPLGALAQANRLVWGGTWAGPATAEEFERRRREGLFIDADHFELQ